MDTPFQPDWASPPGHTIRDILDEYGPSVARFARGTGLTETEATALLEGELPITLSLARRLAMLFNTSVEFWMVRDYEYRRDSGLLPEPIHPGQMPLPLELAS